MLVHSLDDLSGLSPGADIGLVGRHDGDISSVPQAPYGLRDPREDHEILDARGCIGPPVTHDVPVDDAISVEEYCRPHSSGAPTTIGLVLKRTSEPECLNFRGSLDLSSRSSAARPFNTAHAPLQHEFRDYSGLLSTPFKNYGYDIWQ
jgi:hypothetical protein